MRFVSLLAVTAIAALAATSVDAQNMYSGQGSQMTNGMTTGQGNRMNNGMTTGQGPMTTGQGGQMGYGMSNNGTMHRNMTKKQMRMMKMNQMHH